jgi:hypothetical protein
MSGMKLPPLPYARALNIGLRTAHIGVTGILLGGHFYGAPAEVLWPVLWLAIATGVVLAGIEAYPGTLWLHQGRGLMVFAKIALLCTIPFAWDYRVPILLAVVVIASIGSHMPARFRCYSILRGEMVKGNTCSPPVSAETAGSTGS